MSEAPKPASGIPVFRISFSNATLLSGLYLAGATLIEAVRRFIGPRWADRASLAMDAFPARALDSVGALMPLKRAYAAGSLSEIQVRLVFGLATVLVIFALGAVVGVLMGFAQWSTQRKSEP